MKRLILFLLALGALPLRAVPPVVSAIAFDGVGHSNFRVTFNVSGTYDHIRTRTIASPGTCAGGTGGRLQGIPNSVPGGFFRTSDMSIVVGGLNASTTYNVCPEVSNNGGGTYSSGVSGSVTTLALPSPHPQLPIDPTSFDTSYLNTGSLAAMSACPTPNAQGYCKETTASNCSDLQSFITDALYNQASRGTIIQIPHGSVCTAAGIGANQILFPVYSVDLVPFAPADVTVGNPGIITFSGGQPFTENQMVTLGNHGFTNPPYGACEHGQNTYAWGSHYYVHIASSTQINLRCSDESGSGIGTTLMEFFDQGSGPGPLYLAPHILTSGNCASTSGTAPCTYQSRNLKWIIIRSDATDAQLPPDGSRINPSYFSSGLGATLVDPIANIAGNTAFVSIGRPDGNEQAMTSHIRFGPGIEFTNATDPSFGTFSYMFFGSEVNSSIVLDRVYLHGGDYPQRWGGLGRPTSDFEGTNFGLVNSWIDNMAEWHPTNGFDSGGIIQSRGPGPTVVHNNHIEGAGILWHFDDSGAANTNGQTWLNGNYNVIRNTFNVPLKYMHGSTENTALCGGCWFGNRQPFEIKGGFRSKMAGNIMDTTFSENTAASVFMAFTAVAGLSMLDVNVYSNTYMHGPGVMNVPTLVAGGGRMNAPPNRFWSHNNLAFDINVSMTFAATASTQGVARGWFFQGPNGGEDTIIENNTIVGNLGILPSVNAMEEIYNEGVVVRNNFLTGLRAVEQGFTQDTVLDDVCTGLIGKTLMDCKFTGNGGYVFANNVLMSTDGSSQGTVGGWYSGLSNYIPSSMSLSSSPGWMQYDASGAGGSYGLTSGSAYRSGSTSRGTDGADVGVDLPKLLRDQGHVRFASVKPIGTTTASVNFVAPDGQPCAVDWSASAFPASGVTPTRVTDSGTVAGPRSVALTGLPAATPINVRIQCAVEQPTFQFTTKPPSTFADFLAGMTLQHDWEFGTGGGRNVTNITDLAVDFTPYGIAGTTVIQQEWERYQVPPCCPGTFNTTNFVFTGSSLDLTATIPGGGGLFDGGINSGEIFTKASWNPTASGKTYAFEGRLKVPPNLQGMWPAFWIYTLTPGQADSSEIDIFEFYKMTGYDAHNWTGATHGPGAGSDIYTIAGFGSPCSWCWTPGTDFSGAYHLYQLVWTPNKEYHFVDGVLIVERNFTWTATGAGGLITNLAVGTNNTAGFPGLQPTSLGEFPMVYSIDHIKQWSTP